MTRRFATLTSLVALVLVCTCVAGVAFAQDDAPAKPRAMYLAIPPHSYFPIAPSSSELTQWTYSFTYQNQKFNPVIVGTDPSKTNVTTTTPVVIIPIKLVFGKTNGNHTYDPNKDIYPGTTLTVTQYIAQSPFFLAINSHPGRDEFRAPRTCRRCPRSAAVSESTSRPTRSTFTFCWAS